jgi:hypothetical protein
MIDLMGEAAERGYKALADAGFDVLTRLGPRCAGARRLPGVITPRVQARSGDVARSHSWLPDSCQLRPSRRVLANSHRGERQSACGRMLRAGGKPSPS